MFPKNIIDGYFGTKWYLLGGLSIPIQKIPGSNEAGLVASHQTGWTGLVSKI
jgi:hypothetical protein